MRDSSPSASYFSDVMWVCEHTEAGRVGRLCGVTPLSEVGKEIYPRGPPRSQDGDTESRIVVVTRRYDPGIGPDIHILEVYTMYNSCPECKTRFLGTFYSTPAVVACISGPRWSLHYSRTWYTGTAEAVRGESADEGS